jgi:hypothetical protein
MMALVCGPILAGTFCVLLFVLTELGMAGSQGIGDYRIQIAGGGAFAATCAVGDRLSKRLRISAMEYAGPVAFSSVVCGLLMGLIFALVGSF